MTRTAAPAEGGKLSVRWADWEADAAAISALRARAFGAVAAEPDRFDPVSRHLVVDHHAAGGLAASARVRLHETAEDLASSYTGQFYDLSPLASARLPALEIGRLCAPDGPFTTTAALYLILAALSAAAVAGDVRLLFGCASFPGVDAAAHRDAISLAVRENPGPDAERPLRRAPERIEPDPGAEMSVERRAAARRAHPSLLRGYLAMGGWVGDHGVVDRDFGTCHIFVALPTEAVTKDRRARFEQALHLAQRVI